jgi:microcystin-dependent protein
MADPFVAEIRPFGFNFAPSGWAQCNGQLLPLSQNTALFSLLGTFYGGDGVSTFALPNLEGCAPMGQGQSPGTSERFLGELGGSQSHMLEQSEIPIHSHSVTASRQPATERDPSGQLFAQASGINIYNDNLQQQTTLAFQALGVTGSSAPHNNMQPFGVLNFCIALQGVFPARP